MILYMTLVDLQVNEPWMLYASLLGPAMMSSVLTSVTSHLCEPTTKVGDLAHRVCNIYSSALALRVGDWGMSPRCKGALGWRQGV